MSLQESAVAHTRLHTICMHADFFLLVFGWGKCGGGGEGGRLFWHNIKMQCAISVWYVCDFCVLFGLCWDNVYTTQTPDGTCSFIRYVDPFIRNLSKT